jgi:hypothetical protein
MFLLGELVACILKMEGNYFFCKQTNQLQKITKLNEMLTLHKSRLTRFTYFEGHCVELELPISFKENTCYIIRRYNASTMHDIVFKRVFKRGTT